MMRASLLLFAAAIVSLAPPARADGPTVGWEWEVDPWEWVTTDARGVPVADQDANACPARLIRTTEMSPVNPALRLVELTRDLGQTLEIRTGPIDYDEDPQLDRILVVLDAFRSAAASCVPGPHGCLVTIPDLVRTMNADAGMTGAVPALQVERDPLAIPFDNIIRRCQLRWDQDPDYVRLDETNTQTNVGLSFASIADGDLDQLFSRVDDASSGWEVSRRAYAHALGLLAGGPHSLPGFSAVGAIADPAVVAALNTPLARALFALSFYIVNAETYSAHYRRERGDEWRGFESKNVQDAFLKTPLREIVLHVRRALPDIVPFLNGLAALGAGDRDALAGEICVAHDAGRVALSCRAKTDAMISILSDPVAAAHRDLLGVIPNEVAMFRWHGRDALVIEARRLMNPLNQASTFVVPAAVELSNKAAMRALLRPLGWN